MYFFVNYGSYYYLGRYPYAPLLNWDGWDSVYLVGLTYIIEIVFTVSFGILTNLIKGGEYTV